MIRICGYLFAIELGIFGGKELFLLAVSLQSWIEAAVR